MFTVKSVLSTLCAFIFSMLLASSCEAGKWTSAQSVQSTRVNGARFYAKIYGFTYTGITPQLGGDRVFQSTGGVPNDPYPGVTTYYHVLKPVTITGDYTGVIGQIFYDADNDPETPDQLIGFLDFTSTQY